MADPRLPLLRGKITSAETYEAPQPGRGSPPAMPSLDPREHRTSLLQQLDTIAQQVAARADNARDELAKREIVAVRPAAGAQLAAAQLDDARADARLVGVMPETGTVVLDVASADLGYLREKIEAFGDDAQVIAKTKKDGSPKLNEHGVQVMARAFECVFRPSRSAVSANRDRGCRVIAIGAKRRLPGALDDGFQARGQGKRLALLTSSF